VQKNQAARCVPGPGHALKGQLPADWQTNAKNPSLHHIGQNVAFKKTPGNDKREYIPSLTFPTSSMHQQIRKNLPLPSLLLARRVLMLGKEDSLPL